MTGVRGAGGAPIGKDAGDDADPAPASRLALWVFVAVVIGAVPLIFHSARTQWFFLDEWDFLADRDLMSFDDLMRPHNEHWSTLPIVAYRLVWQAVGLRHYWPYLVPTVAAHLATAVLLRVVMVRAGVHVWIATTAASLFALFGGGRENIAWAFQIGFTGALALGLGAVVVADHDGRAVRRDVMAVLAAAAALACSGVGVVMVVALAISVTIRRGWRAGVAVAAPPAALFAIWYLVWGRAHPRPPRSDAGRTLRLMADTVLSTAGRLGPVHLFGWALGAAAIVGLVLAVGRIGRGGLRGTIAPLVGLAVAGLVFIALTGVGRAALTVEAASRYRHIVAALLLPAVCLGLSELGRRWAPATWIVVVLLAAAIPVNVRALESPDAEANVTRGNADLWIALALTEAPPTMPRSVSPSPDGGPEVTVGWLADARAEGAFPEWTAAARALQPSAELLLALEPIHALGGQGCRPVRPLQGARLMPGQVLRVPAETVTLTEIVDGEARPVGATFRARPLLGGGFTPTADGPQVRLRAHRAMHLRVQARHSRGPAEVCSSV